MAKNTPRSVPAGQETVESAAKASERLREIVDRQIGVLLPKPQRTEVVTRVESIIQQEMFSGPVPHPRHLEHYEEILPGSAERILVMAEKAQEHTAAMDHKVVDAQVDIGKRGLNYGLVAFLVVIGAAVFFGVTGQPWLAGSFLTAAVFGAVTSFISGRRSRAAKQELTVESSRH